MVEIADNPLLAPWATPFGMPPFDAIKSQHYLPAFEAGMAAQRAELDAIVAEGQAPTFANTVLALENSGRELTRVSGAFGAVAGANTNDDLQAIERTLAPKMAEHHSAITSNAALFGRIDQLFQKRDTLGLNAEDLRLLEREHRGFVRSGAALSVAAKTRMAAIKQRLATLQTQFSQNVLADEKSFVLPLPLPGDRDGLPGFVLDAAAATAKSLGAQPSHVVTLSRSLIEPFLTFSARRDLRELAFKAWQQRGALAGATDNRRLASEILALRQEQAKLLGFASFADFKLDDSMAKTPAAVRQMLEPVWDASLIAAQRERDKLQAAAAADGANIAIAPWDWRYYAEKVRKADYDLDEAEVKPYLTLEQMIAASFHVAERLFGLSFRERFDVPRYHPDMRAFEVTGAGGRHVGLFLADYFARPSKRSGAWMSQIRRQEKFGGQTRPVVVNVLNLAKPAPGEPALLSFDDARTLFHEFGHGLHGLLSDVTYAALSGTAVSRDFVELPSQLYEHWLMCKPVLSKFARHVSTGEPMPDALIEKLRATRNFNQGFQTVEYLASSLVDMDAHSQVTPESADAMALQASTLARIGMPAEIVMRHATPHFQHIYAGGYAAGYYSYMWSEMLDADAFAAFEETGDVFDPVTAQKLLTHIYSAGGKQEPDAAYIAFRGRLPSVDSVLRQRGFVAPHAT